MTVTFHAALMGTYRLGGFQSSSTAAMEESAYTKDRRMETIKSSLTVTEGGANTEEKPAPTAI